jgi:hypothetical protein
MKTPCICFILLGSALLAASGCESVGARLRERFDPPPCVRQVDAPADRTFEAAKAAMETMGYRILAQSARRGEIDAAEQRGQSEDPHVATQRFIHIQVSATNAGGAQVEIAVREEEEVQSGPGRPLQTSRQLATGQTHERFFAALMEQLSFAGAK